MFAQQVDGYLKVPKRQNNNIQTNNGLKLSRGGICVEIFIYNNRT